MEDAHQHLAPWSFYLGPGFQSLDLAVQIRPLIIPADPCVEDQESIICLAKQSVNLTARNTSLDSYPHGLHLACFDPAPYRDRVQPQFLCRLPYPQLLSITFSHDRDSITERYFNGNCSSPHKH